MTKTVLVTGLSGFIGRAAVPILKARGFEVYGIGRRQPNDLDIAFYEADLLAPNELDAIVKALSATHLLHLAWHTEPGQYWTSSKNLDWVSASLRLVRYFAEAGGVRAVCAGSCAEYKWDSAPLVETESVCDPSTLYGASKDSLRRILEAYAQTAGISFAWGRVFYLYGPNEKSGRLVSDAIQQLIAGEPFLTTEGYQKRDFLHVCDAAMALAALLESAVNGPINIASGEALPVRTLLERLASLIGRPDLLRFGQKQLLAGEPANIVADVQRLSKDVGFTPHYDLESGLVDTLAWWQVELAGHDKRG